MQENHSLFYLGMTDWPVNELLSTHEEAARENRLRSKEYLDQQERLYQMALAIVDEDGDAK